MNILVLNGGSSSFKCWFAGLPDDSLPRAPVPPQWKARADWSRHTGVADIRIERADGATVSRTLTVGAPVGVLKPVIESLWDGEARVLAGASEIDLVGHRIVHGGPDHRAATWLSPGVRSAIAQQVEFAPAHNRFELEAIQAVDQVIGPEVRQAAVFDTGFHSTLPPAAFVYPGPYDWYEQGVRRYGFHGINHRYATERATEVLGRDAPPERLVVCHLGNGASLAAVRAGRSVDTTMGFTPLEGLMMGTRCGSIDPGIIIYLIRHRGYSAEKLDEVLNRESGLLGVSGQSGDMREIESKVEAGDERAKLAFDVYVHRLVRETGSMAAVLGGLDALVFTGGVGEHSHQIRSILCAQLAFLGVKLDDAKNRAPGAGDQDLATPDSSVRVLLIAANEEWQIAQECHALATNSD